MSFCFRIFHLIQYFFVIEKPWSAHRTFLNKCCCCCTKWGHTANDLFFPQVELIVVTSNKSAQPEMESESERERVREGGSWREGGRKASPVMGGCESAAPDPPTLGPAPSPVNHLTCQSLLCIVFCLTFNFPSFPPSLPDSVPVSLHPCRDSLCCAHVLCGVGQSLISTDNKASASRLWNAMLSVTPSQCE